MKHRYVICLLIISLLVGMLCIPASAKSIYEFDYDISTAPNGDTLITIHVPLDDSMTGHSNFDDSNFIGPSYDLWAYPEVSGQIDFFSSSIDFTDLPDSTLVSLSAIWTCDKGHTTPTGRMYVRYQSGERYFVDPEEGTQIYYETHWVSGDAYTFVAGVNTSLGSITLNREEAITAMGDCESFSVGLRIDKFTSLFDEPVMYTITLTQFDVTFSLEDAYNQEIETGKTNQLLEDLKESNKEISDKLDQIANALEPAPGAGEGAKDEAAVQGGQIDNLNDQMNDLEKPDLTGQGNISDIISPGDLTSYTTFLASTVNAPYIKSVVMLALILSLAAYVLFGKRG